MSTTTLKTNPDTLHILPDDSIQYGYDATAFLNTGETVSALTTRLITEAGQPLTLTDAPISNPTGGYQRLRGSELTPGKSYALVWIAATSSGDTLSQVTTVVADYL